MKKKELIIITNTCYPIQSASGALSLKYSKILQEKYNIRIISIQCGYNKYSGECIEGNIHYTISEFLTKYQYIFNEKCNKCNGIKMYFYKIILNFIRIIRFLIRKFIYIDGNWWYAKKSEKMLYKLWNEKKFDAILSVSSPIGSHIAAMKFKEKHKSVYWVSFWGDLFSSKMYKQNIFISMKKNIEIENTILNKSDFVMTTDEIYPQFINRVNKNKIKNIHYTISNAILHDKNINKKEKSLKIVYMGSFNEKIRNPKFMLETFSKLDIEYNLLLYSVGCENIIEKYEKKSNGKIKLIGRIPYNELQIELKKSNFLVNVSNSVSTSVPSKLLELVSYKKPIIDFYYSNNEENFLKKYPLCLRIKMDILNEDIIFELKKFMNENKNSNIDAKKIETIYNEYTEKNLIIEIKKIFSIDK